MANRPLITAVSYGTGLTKKKAEEVVNAVTHTIKEALSEGEKVTLVGFGTFQVVNRRARRGINPQTGEKIHIPEKTVVKFVPGKVLRQAVS